MHLETVLDDELDDRCDALPSEIGQPGDGYRGPLQPPPPLKSPSWSENRKLPVHRWVPWVAGFSAEFVDSCLRRFLPERRRTGSRPRVLDPFAGVGTTLLQASLRGVDSIGFEINPYAALATRAKLAAFGLDADELEALALRYFDYACAHSAGSAHRRPQGFRTRLPFFSPQVEGQVLAFLDFVETIRDPSAADLFRLALGACMVGFSNYVYGPSLGSRSAAGKPPVEEACVGEILMRRLMQMADDIRWLSCQPTGLEGPGRGRVFDCDFLAGQPRVEPESIDLAVTSPPYLNNYHYIRNTRPQLYWLSLAQRPRDLKRLEESNLGKYWQTVRSRRTLEPEFSLEELDRLIESLRRTRPAEKTYGGPGWANYVAAYFNDSRRFLRRLASCLRPGAAAVVVLGNSIIQGHEVRTDGILAQIARREGFREESLECARDRRVGDSITRSDVRRGDPSDAVLYEKALILRRE